MITKVLLKNFKCFRSAEITLKPITLFAGQNGSGKSTLLQSLLAIRQSYVPSGFHGRLLLNGHLTRLGRGQDVLFEGAEEEVIILGLESDDGLSVSWTFQYDPLADALPATGVSRNPGGEIESCSIFSKQFHYLEAERSGPRTTFPMAEHLVTEDRTIGSTGEFAAHFLHHYGQSISVSEQLRHPGAESPQLKYQVEAWLSEVSPNLRVTITPNTNTDQVEIRYSFVRGKHTTNEYRSTNVAFGISYALPIVVAALSLAPGGLLIVENPEAHLHPRAQASLGRLLALAAQGGIQIFVESHSDHVVNALRLAVRQGTLDRNNVQIHFFNRPTESHLDVHTVTPTIDENGRLSQWPPGFFDEWDKSVAELMIPKGD